jgi:hypothetical protein
MPNTDLQPGRETDVAVAIRIGFCGPEPGKGTRAIVPHYSTNPAAALEALEEWQRKRKLPVIMSRADEVAHEGNRWRVHELNRQEDFVNAPTFPLAIARLICGTERTEA